MTVDSPGARSRVSGNFFRHIHRHLKPFFQSWVIAQSAIRLRDSEIPSTPKGSLERFRLLIFQMKTEKPLFTLSGPRRSRIVSFMNISERSKKRCKIVIGKSIEPFLANIRKVGGRFIQHQFGSVNWRINPDGFQDRADRFRACDTARCRQKRTKRQKNRKNETTLLSNKNSNGRRTREFLLRKAMILRLQNLPPFYSSNISCWFVETFRSNPFHSLIQPCLIETVKTSALKIERIREPCATEFFNIK